MSKLGSVAVCVYLCCWPGFAAAQLADFLPADITAGIPQEILKAFGGFLPDGIIGEPQIGGPGVLDPDNLPVGVRCRDAAEMVLGERGECSESVSRHDDLQPD